MEKENKMDKDLTKKIDVFSGDEEIEALEKVASCKNFGESSKCSHINNGCPESCLTCSPDERHKYLLKGGDFYEGAWKGVL